MRERRSLLSVGRRFAAGIDVSPRAVRVAVLSRRRVSRSRVRVDALAVEPLPAGAFAVTGDGDWAAVARALSAAMDRVRSARCRSALHGVMALPRAALTLASLDLHRMALRDGAHAHVEPAALAAAERATGQARDALALDWRVEGPGAATVVATARAHVDTRVEAAASAGVALVAIDGEPYAALRAIRHVARREASVGEPYLAIWVGCGGVHGWLVAAGRVEREICYPAPEHADLADALRGLAQTGAARCAFVAGDAELLGGARISLADVADLLGCVVLPFECAGLCHPARPAGDALARSPAFAVAVGLALRGVFE
ncbi:pilus assembly protein PilM [Burkholderia alba]|uniref:pilus assembly protein PilM n=1 Tax=Burkholderia alba TaxID=2683677 RepID=UPI002B053591|nr:pilus assembly protein PilM [Burkholderia alba]